MPLSYSLVGDVVEIEIAGFYAVDELRALVARMLADPDLPEKFRVLVDVRRSEVVPRVADIGARIDLAMSARDRIDGRIAVVVGDDLRFGLVRMVEAHLEPLGIEVHPFREIKTARAWLAVRTRV
jgi:hypothetical protein